jgi:hypothetical protein
MGGVLDKPIIAYGNLDPAIAFQCACGAILALSGLISGL